MRTIIKIALGALALHALARRALPQTLEARDRRLQERVRARLQRVVAQPEAIEVVVNHGDVSLRGEVQSDERDRVLNTVLKMGGVLHVHNRLAVPDEIVTGPP